MAEFCKQCAEQLFGDDPRYNDAAHLMTELEGTLGFCVSFLCEGCGFTIVDYNGKCQGACLNKDHSDHVHSHQLQN